MYAIINKLRRFSTAYVSPIDRKILCYSLLMLLIGFVFIVINLLGAGYPGNDYIPTIWKLMAPFIVLALLLAWRFRGEVPRLAFFTRFYTLYFILIITMGVMTNGIQFTPFPVVDKLLAHWDSVLGINTPKILAWMHQHPSWRMGLGYAYNALVVQLFVVPILLTLLKLERALNQYFLLIGLSFIIGGLIYYFLPTAAPASVLTSPYFVDFEHSTALKFFQIHHHIAPTTKDGGMIALPSFHVIYAVVCSYVLRNKWWLLLPAALINLFAIASTVLLGAHYLMDVILGILIAIFCIQRVNRVLRLQQIKLSVLQKAD